MTTLHTFGCSITQGFALPDIVRPALDSQGRPLTDQEVADQDIPWTDIHLYEPSKYAWPQVLADKLGLAVVNHARRGACFQQIARQCLVAAPTIKSGDTVIVMWTYLSRLSLQWPARTAVPFCNIADPRWGWKTVILGFNKLFGLERARSTTEETELAIQKWIEESTKNTYLDPKGTYNRYYNSLVLQSMTDGFLRSTGARVIHLSVEMEPTLRQLEESRSQLDPTLREPYSIPDPTDWYTLKVDHASCYTILDPSIPPAANDMHPSVTHHKNFAEHIHKLYFP
jgi:hypothetical protein